MISKENRGTLPSKFLPPQAVLGSRACPGGLSRGSWAVPRPPAPPGFLNMPRLRGQMGAGLCENTASFCPTGPKSGGSGTQIWSWCLASGPHLRLSPASTRTWDRSRGLKCQWLGPAGWLAEARCAAVGRVGNWRGVCFCSRTIRTHAFPCGVGCS